MTLIAQTLELFFTERMAKQRQASPATIKSYRNTFRVLLAYLQDRTGSAPSRLDWADHDIDAISRFLDYLEAGRHNTPRTRNARLAALRSLFRYASLRHPEHALLIQRVLAIPQKRYDKAIVSFLEVAEVDALLSACDLSRWDGRRDRALIALAVQTGLRLSELTGATNGDLELGNGAHLRCTGKGRKQCCVPLTSATVAVLRVWRQERGGLRDDPLFPTRTGRRLSDDAVEARVAKYKTLAAVNCPSIAGKRLTGAVRRPYLPNRDLFNAGGATTMTSRSSGIRRSSSCKLSSSTTFSLSPERTLMVTLPLSTSWSPYPLVWVFPSAHRMGRD